MDHTKADVPNPGNEPVVIAAKAKRARYVRVTATRLPGDVNAVYEIVIDGLDAPIVRRAMAVGIRAACRDGVRMISAGNYGGKLGQHQLRLHDVLAES